MFEIKAFSKIKVKLLMVYTTEEKIIMIFSESYIFKTIVSRLIKLSCYRQMYLMYQPNI